MLVDSCGHIATHASGKLSASGKLGSPRAAQCASGKLWSQSSSVLHLILSSNSLLFSFVLFSSSSSTSN